MYFSRSNITNENVYVCPNSVPTTNLSVQLIFTKPLVELHLLDQEYYRHKYHNHRRRKKDIAKCLLDSNKPSLDHRRVS